MSKSEALDALYFLYRVLSEEQIRELWEIVDA